MNDGPAEGGKQDEEDQSSENDCLVDDGPAAPSPI